MYKKLALSFLVFQFVLTLMGQIVCIRYTVLSEEAYFAAAAQNYFDRGGAPPPFCRDDGSFAVLHAAVTVAGKAMSVTGKSARLASWTEGILPLFFLWMMLSLFASLLLARGVFSALYTPIKAIEGGVLAWEKEGNVPTVPIFSEDELGRVGKGVFETAKKLEAERKEKLRFLRHELLNPIAGVRGAAETIWQETGDEVSRILMRESVRMEEMVLWGTEKENAVRINAVFSFSSLLSSARILCRGMASRAGRKCICVAKGPFPSLGKGEENAWRGALLNLQQNALRHSPSSSKTVFGMFSLGGEVALVFFNRVQKCRGGEGRGLAAVRRVCRLYGGRFFAKETKNGAFLAVLYIPAL